MLHLCHVAAFHMPGAFQTEMCLLFFFGDLQKLGVLLVTSNSLPCLLVGCCLARRRLQSPLYARRLQSCSYENGHNRVGASR